VALVVRNRTLGLTCDDALSVVSFSAVQRVEELRQAVDGDETETGIEVCFACESDHSECCCRECAAFPSLSGKSRLIASKSFAMTTSIPGQLSCWLPDHSNAQISSWTVLGLRWEENKMYSKL